MKKQLLIISGILAASAALCLGEPNTRSERIMWTNRALTSGTYSESSSIEPTINQFWNVLMDDSATCNKVAVVETRSVPVKTVAAKPTMEASQTRTEKEHRGHFGINLFNLIPLIDIVHGEVQTESSDRVSGSK